MSWDSVPWFVGGGAHHSPEVARLLAYAATAGAEGVVSPGDLKVAPLDTPGAAIRVLTGACLVPNLAASGTQQTYVGRNISEDVKGISSTGASIGRNDLIIAQVKDPFMPGEPWADPEDVTVGPYIFTEVIPNVAASVVASNASATTYLRAQGISGIPLGAVLLDPNTSVITTVRDLRALARPRSSSRQYGGPPDIPADVIYGSSPRPVEAGDPYSMIALPGSTYSVEIPTWATHMDVIAMSTGVIAGVYNDPNAFPANQGATLVKVGSMYGPLTNWDFRSGGNVQLVATNTGQEVPANLRGTTQPATLRVRMDTGQLGITRWSTVIFLVAFYERVV